MSTTTDSRPTDGAAAEPSRLARNWKYVTLAVAIVGWAIAAYQAVKRGEPIPAPPLGDLVQPIRADEMAIPINYEGHRYHGGHEHDHPEHVEQNGRPWPTKRLTYWIDYSTVPQLRPALSSESVSAAVRQAWGWWAESLDIDPLEVADANQALVRIRFERMDGPSGVLAESYLADGTLRPKNQRYDAAERWTVGPPASGLLSLPTVACHEIGHVLGLGHDNPTAPAVMRPMYTSSIPREQAQDINRMVALGYARRPKAPPAPTDLLTFPVQARTDDVIQSLEKAGFKVHRP